MSACVIQVRVCVMYFYLWLCGCLACKYEQCLKYDFLCSSNRKTYWYPGTGRSTWAPRLWSWHQRRPQRPKKTVLHLTMRTRRRRTATPVDLPGEWTLCRVIYWVSEALSLETVVNYVIYCRLEIIDSRHYRHIVEQPRHTNINRHVYA